MGDRLGTLDAVGIPLLSFCTTTSTSTMLILLFAKLRHAVWQRLKLEARLGLSSQDIVLFKSRLDLLGDFPSQLEG